MGFVLSLFFAFGWIVLYYFRVEDISRTLADYSRSERVWIGAAVTTISVHNTVGCVMATFLSVPLWRALLSGAIFATGIAFWLWGRAMVGPLRVRRPPDEPPRELRTDGAFGVVRHPMYLGYLIAASAPVLAMPRLLLVLTFCGCVVVLGVRAVQEERRLRAHVGARYASYCAQVSRLIPFVW